MYPGFQKADEHLRRSLVYFDEAEADPDPISLNGPTWHGVKRRMGEMAEGFDGPRVARSATRPRRSRPREP